METIIVFTISILVFLVIIAFKKWYEYSKSQALKNMVSWSVTGGDGIPLWTKVSNSQINLKLSAEYCITGDEEWAYAKEIIEEYKQDLMRSYFRGNLIIIKSKYAVSGENYFMAALYAFLSDHQCDYEFLKYDMHKERVSYKEYGSWGGTLFDATYSLTEFALVFHKMHYITYMYCRRNDILNGYVPEWNEKNLKEILDTKQIQLSRY